MISQLDRESGAAQRRPPQTNSAEVLTVDLAIDLSYVERGPQQSDAREDVRREGAIVPEVPASCQSAESGRHVTQRLVINEQRGFSVELDPVSEEPSHLWMECNEAEIASRLSKERAPRVAPSEVQAAGPA